MSAYLTIWNVQLATTLEHKIADLEKSIGTNIPTPTNDSGDVNIPTQDPSKSDAPLTKTQSDNNIQEVVACFINEEKEKEKDKRRLNIIIVHNVPESQSEDGLTRKTTMLILWPCNMCKSQLNADTSMSKAFRLGKKDTKPRLFQVCLSSEAEKATVLNNCTKLRNPKTPRSYHNIFKTPDLTPKE